jgi:hypothetical protein
MTRPTLPTTATRNVFTRHRLSTTDLDGHNNIATRSTASPSVATCGNGDGRADRAAHRACHPVAPRPADLRPAPGQ